MRFGEKTGACAFGRIGLCLLHRGGERAPFGRAERQRAVAGILGITDGDPAAGAGHLDAVAAPFIAAAVRALTPGGSGRFECGHLVNPPFDGSCSSFAAGVISDADSSKESAVARMWLKSMLYLSISSTSSRYSVLVWSSRYTTSGSARSGKARMTNGFPIPGWAPAVNGITCTDTFGMAARSTR